MTDCILPVNTGRVSYIYNEGDMMEGSLGEIESVSRSVFSGDGSAGLYNTAGGHTLS